MSRYRHKSAVPFADNSLTQRMTCLAPQYLTAEKYVFSMAVLTHQKSPMIGCLNFVRPIIITWVMRQKYVLWKRPRIWKSDEKSIYYWCSKFSWKPLGQKNVDEGWVVAGTDNFIGADKTKVLDFVDSFNIGCCDLNDMRKTMVDSDWVFHCAATVQEGHSVFSLSFITKNNCEASVSTFTAAINCSVKRIVFCPSMARYSNQPTPFTEGIRPELP